MELLHANHAHKTKITSEDLDIWWFSEIIT